VFLKRGDRYKFRDVDIEVTRVDAYGRWADIKCHTGVGGEWTKRQPLPFPEEFRKIDEKCSSSSTGRCKHIVMWRVKAANNVMFACGTHLNNVCAQMLETGVDYMTLEGEGINGSQARSAAKAIDPDIKAVN
jgi:hypothetical protein